MFKLNSKCKHSFRIRLKGLNIVTPLDNVLDVAEKVLPMHRVVGKVIKKILSVNILRVISIF